MAFSAELGPGAIPRFFAPFPRVNCRLSAGPHPWLKADKGSGNAKGRKKHEMKIFIGWLHRYSASFCMFVALYFVSYNGIVLPKLPRGGLAGNGLAGEMTATIR